MSAFYFLCNYAKINKSLIEDVKAIKDKQSNKSR